MDIDVLLVWGRKIQYGRKTKERGKEIPLIISSVTFARRPLDSAEYTKKYILPPVRNR
jgi:hypothetical protein